MTKMPSRPSPESALVEPSKASGTQSILRTTSLLRLVAANNRSGLRLVDITRSTGLDRSTVHRILQCLVDEHFLEQDLDRRYFLGAVTFELGLSAAPRFNLRELCDGSLERIARISGDMAFLTVRSGHDAVCLDRKEGTYPIRTHTFEIGARRPLGVGAGSLAILSALPIAESHRIVAHNARHLEDYNGSSANKLLAQVDQTRKLGHALREGSVAGARAIGLVIRNRFGEPFAALSISAISSRMTKERQPELIALLKMEVRAVEKRLAASGSD